jgi:hypothetical protein
VLGVHGAVGQADVIENVVQFGGGDLVADVGFDQVAQPGGFFNAAPGGSAYVQNELAAIGAGKEILAQPGDQQEGA